MISSEILFFLFYVLYKMRVSFTIPILAFLLYLLITSILSPHFETKLMVKEYEFANFITSRICHQFPTRCYYIFGSNVGLCSRCFSTYTGIFITLIIITILNININSLNRFILGALLCAPLIIDGLTQFYQIRTSTNFLRTATGLLAGTGITIFISGFIQLITKLYVKFNHTYMRKEVG
jgi:uncharacterized membrane protein